ncbi:MAG TPA: right-handed parallel beta-helix repeat-containing protein, partial [Chthoniobacterales bacterium]|nr:right-handed parallel beta-helix repeat-containing protein [Chthoniobacterales bacterium]
RVWVQHCDAQWLTGSDGTIQNSRVSDSWADGINVNNGNRKNPDAQGMRLTVQNNFIRGSGDDCIATYSDAGDKGDNSQMDGTKILNNTTVAPWWANSLRVAGGKNVLVQGNLVSDAASNNGMDISIFGKTGQPLESATITGNVILRGGGWNATYRYGVSISAATNVIFTNNVIRDSRRNGLEISGEVAKATLTGNVIDHPAGAGVEIAAKAKGSASFQRNTVRNLLPGQLPFRDLSKGSFSVTQSGNGW